MKNPLCPIIALLTIAPHPLSPLEVAVVIGLLEEDVRQALQLMRAADRVVEVGGRFTVPPTKEVLHEAIGAIRRQHRDREISVLSLRLERAVSQASAHHRPATTSEAVVAVAG